MLLQCADRVAWAYQMDHVRIGYDNRAQICIPYCQLKVGSPVGVWIDDDAIAIEQFGVEKYRWPVMNSTSGKLVTAAGLEVVEDHSGSPGPHGRLGPTLHTNIAMFDHVREIYDIMIDIGERLDFSGVTFKIDGLAEISVPVTALNAGSSFKVGIGEKFLSILQDGEEICRLKIDDQVPRALRRATAINIVEHWENGVDEHDVPVLAYIGYPVLELVELVEPPAHW